MTGDEDCCDCVYGAEFLDDGVPCRYITTMCDRCKEESAKALDFLLVARAQRQPPAGHT